MEGCVTRRGLAAAALVSPLAVVASAAQAKEGPESTFDEIRRTGLLRIGGIQGSLPLFQKDLTTGGWSGAAVEMAKDLASAFDAEVRIVETTFANSVLDLQSNRIDLAFNLNPTPKRALVIGFTNTFHYHPYGVLARQGLSPQTWADINRPEVRIVVDIGTLHEVVARRYAPRAQITALKTRDECNLELASGRVDMEVMAGILAVTTAAKNPNLGSYHTLKDPTVKLPVSFGVRRETDPRYLDVVNAWIEFNVGIGQIADWWLDALVPEGLTRSNLPPELLPGPPI
jgi:polar amino acid transport system substrate-binding protein